MEPDPWIKLLHELGTIIAAVAAAIAATSSLRNGRTLKQNGSHPKEAVPPGSAKPATKKTSSGDWYVPPDLN